MRTIWRLLKTRFASSAFDGEGARLYGGRWSSPGTRVAYASNSASLAILEVLVHLDASQMLSTYSLISASVPEKLIEELPQRALPSNWRVYPAPAETAMIGDAWVRRGSSVVLRVPSVVVDAEYNFLVNPAHADFAKLVIGDAVPFVFDHRLRK
jgi:RES domain-containing protein